MLLYCIIFLSFISHVIASTCTYYGNYNALPVSSVTCSDHTPGLYSNPSWGYNYQTLISQVSQIHNSGNLYATAWSSVTGDGDTSHCLHCIQVTYGSKSVNVTVIDMKGDEGVDLSDAAFDCLFGSGSHVGGGSYSVSVTSISSTPCVNGGGCSATTSPTPPPSGACTKYTVVSGDYGYAIAQKLGVDFTTQLSVWNPNVNWDNLAIGQQICASASGSHPPTTTTTTAPAPSPPSPPSPPAGSGSCGTFDISAKTNFIGYWGQNSGDHENDLRTYCADTTFTAFHLAFLNDFGDPSVPGSIGMNLAGHCWDSCGGSQPGLLCCPTIASDIQYCQAKGKKVLLSLGGAIGTYSLTSTTGTRLADFLWNYFLGGSTTDQRPFGKTILDGIDLDIENNNPAGYAALISRLRQHFNGASQRYYLSGAPQCYYPDASLGPGSGAALTIGGPVTLDYIVVQFYNNGPCNCGGSNFVNAFNQYANTSVTKVMVGFLGSSASGAGYVTTSSLTSALAKVSSNPKFGGVMGWDVGTSCSNMAGSASYARTVANYLQSQFSCKGSSSSSPAPSPTTSAPSKTPTPTPSSGIPQWSSKGVAYKTNQCVQYNGKYYRCLQAHTSNTAWSPTLATALWKADTSCKSSYAETVADGFTSRQNWLIPLIAVVGVLLITIPIVLLKKRGRERTYSQAVAAIQAETTLPAPQEEEKIEEQALGSPTSTGEPPSISVPVTNKGSYEQVPMMSPSASQTLPSEWEKRKDTNSGQEFYYNKSTGVSQWELP